MQAWAALLGVCICGTAGQVGTVIVVRWASATTFAITQELDVVLNFMFDAWLFSRHVGTLSISGATLICSGIGFLALSKAAKPSAQEEDAKKSANCIKTSSELLPADTA